MADLEKIEQRKRRRQKRTEERTGKLIPTNRVYSSKKRHLGEPLQDFKARRRISNQKRLNKFSSSIPTSSC